MTDRPTHPLCLFGDFGLWAPDGTKIALATRKGWGILAALVLANGRPVSRDELAADLWPMATDIQARASLRQDLAILRKALSKAGLDVITTQKDWIKGDFPPDRVDVLAFERGLTDPDSDRIRDLLALYRGPLLAGVRIRADPFEDWLWLERDRLKNRAQEALQTLLSRDEANGDDAVTLATARQLLVVEPTHEPAYRAVMRVHMRAADRGAAWRVFKQCEKLLRRDLDTEPSRYTIALAEQIRTQTRPKQQHNAQSSQVVVLCVGLSLPVATGLAPDLLHSAQKLLHTRVRKAVMQAGGHCVPGLGDRQVAVFSGAVFQQDCDGVAALAMSLVQTPIMASDSVAVPVKAGIGGGPALLSVPTQDQDDHLVVAEALHRANARMSAAAGGAVICGADGAPDPEAGYDLHPLAPPFAEDPTAARLTLR